MFPADTTEPEPVAAQHIGGDHLSTPLSHRNRQLRSALASTVGLVAAVIAAKPAAASHDTTPNPDNATQDVERISLTSVGQVADLQGELQVGRSEIAFQTGTSDLHVRDIDYSVPRGWAGLTWCSAFRPLSLSTCDHFQIRFNLRFDETGYLTTDGWKTVGCHEFGHAAGLGHRADQYAEQSCMKSPSSSQVLTNHDLITINGDV